MNRKFRSRHLRAGQQARLSGSDAGQATSRAGRTAKVALAECAECALRDTERVIDGEMRRRRLLGNSRPTRAKSRIVQLTAPCVTAEATDERRM